jgi:hypothetical protein
MVLERCGVKLWTESAWSSLMGKICEHGDELSGSMKAADFLICCITIHFEKKILRHGVCRLLVVFKEKK